MITTLNGLWDLPPIDLVLSTDDVHVYRASLEQMRLRVQSFHQTLTTDEVERAEHFLFQKDREHFIVGRGLLRAILALYMNIEPGRVRFCYNPYGKPALLDIPGQDTLNFNVTHSHGFALYAVTRGRQIGIDIERIRMDVAYEQIAARFFSPRDNAMLATLPVSLRREGFFTYWTCKEAYIKARGEGLSLSLDQFDVLLALGEPAAMIAAKDPQESSRWSLQVIIPVPGYVGAVAVEGQDWHLTRWQCPE